MNISIISEILNSLIEERNNIYNRIHENDLSINELSVYLNSIDTESEDYKVFSPFNSRDIYDDKIDNIKNDRNSLIDDNNILFSKISALDTKIEELKIFISEFNDSKFINIKEEEEYINNLENKISFEKDQLSALLNDIINKRLLDIIHSLNLSEKFIDQDYFRAKLEINNCIDIINNIIEDINNSI